MAIDLNDFEPQSGGFELIPKGAIVPLVMTIRPGGMGEGGWLKASRSSDAQMLDCEFTVSEGHYAGRKFWQNIVISGGRQDDYGQSIAAKISMALLRAILESARNVKPDDQSDAARSARRVNGWQDFNGMTFLAKIGVEKDKSGNYEDKNKIALAITPDMKEYSAPQQTAWSSQQQAQSQQQAAAWQNQQPGQQSAAWNNQQPAQNARQGGPRPSWA